MSEHRHLTFHMHSGKGVVDAHVCAWNLHLNGCLLNLECVSALYSTPYVWYRMLGWVRHIQCIVKYGSWLCEKDGKQLHALWRSWSLANLHVEFKCFCDEDRLKCKTFPLRRSSSVTQQNIVTYKDYRSQTFYTSIVFHYYVIAQQLPSSTLQYFFYLFIYMHFFTHMQLSVGAVFIATGFLLYVHFWDGIFGMFT